MLCTSSAASGNPARCGQHLGKATRAARPWRQHARDGFMSLGGGRKHQTRAAHRLPQIAIGYAPNSLPVTDASQMEAAATPS